VPLKLAAVCVNCSDGASPPMAFSSNLDATQHLTDNPYHIIVSRALIHEEEE